MKIIKLLFTLTFVILIGGFGYFALIDVPVQQSDITKEISHEVFRER